MHTQPLRDAIKACKADPDFVAFVPALEHQLLLGETVLSYQICKSDGPGCILVSTRHYQVHWPAPALTHCVLMYDEVGQVAAVVGPLPENLCKDTEQQLMSHFHDRDCETWPLISSANAVVEKLLPSDEVLDVTALKARMAELRAQLVSQGMSHEEINAMLATTRGVPHGWPSEIRDPHHASRMLTFTMIDFAGHGVYQDEEKNDFIFERDASGNISRLS